MREILIVAGEASGDLHGAALARALRAIEPRVALAGLGGARMQDAGVALLEDAERMAVMGFVEVLRTIPHHWALLRTLEARLRSGRVGLVIAIDYPGFNMKVAAAAQRAGVPVLYYITPQVWAWGAGRLPKLRKLITRAAVILPFEQALLASHGIDATFVGHPLLDRAAAMPSREDARRSLGLDPNAPVLALFPGSRSQELHRHLAPFVETARNLQERMPNLSVLVSGARGMRIDQERCPYPIVEDASFSVLRAADVALCKSGTTTLEAAVANCPMAVAYRTNPLTYAIAKRVVTIPNIGLVNVVAGQQIVREFVQGAVVPDDVASYLFALLTNQSGMSDQQREALGRVREQLGEPGASARVAQMAMGMLT